MIHRTRSGCSFSDKNLLATWLETGKTICGIPVLQGTSLRYHRVASLQPRASPVPK